MRSWCIHSSAFYYAVYAHLLYSDQSLLMWMVPPRGSASTYVPQAPLSVTSHQALDENTGEALISLRKPNLDSQQTPSPLNTLREFQRNRGYHRPS
jgi:hypothetical protein